MRRLRPRLVGISIFFLATVYLNAQQVRTRYGGMSDMALWRWKHNGHYTSKAGKRRKRLGRPNADPQKIELARHALASATGVLKTAKLAGSGRLRARSGPRARARTKTEFCLN